MAIPPNPLLEEVALEAGTDVNGILNSKFEGMDKIHKGERKESKIESLGPFRSQVRVSRKPMAEEKKSDVHEQVATSFEKENLFLNPIPSKAFSTGSCRERNGPNRGPRDHIYLFRISPLRHLSQSQVHNRIQSNMHSLTSNLDQRYLS